MIEDPAEVPENEDWKSFLNDNSQEVLQDCRLEPSLAGFQPGEPVQFERLGYFTPDSVDSRPDRLVFNRSVTLKDTWAKMQHKS